MHYAARGAVFFLIALPFFVFAKDTAPSPKPAPSSKPSPCELAKKRALGKVESTETITGDTKSATKDVCIGAVFKPKEKNAKKTDIKNYECTGERARVNLSKSGVLIETRGDAKVPLGVCATTICEEGKPCRPAKLTTGIKPKDLGTVDAPLDPGAGPSRLQELQKKYEEAQKVLDSVYSSGPEILPTGDVLKDQTDEIVKAEASKRTAIAEMEKLLGALPGGETSLMPEGKKDVEISEERLRAIANTDWSRIKADTPDFLEPPANVKEDLNNITNGVIRRAYPSALTERLPNGEVTVVRERETVPESPGHTFMSQNPDARHIFYDNNTGTRFMEVNPTTGDVTLIQNGHMVPMRDEYGNLSRDPIARVLDTPAKFNTFWNEYLGAESPVPPLSYKAITNPDGGITHIVADSGAGIEKTISYPDYAMLQNYGADLLGTRASMEAIYNRTNGLFKIAEPSILAEPGAGLRDDPNIPLSSMTPVSPEVRANVTAQLEKAFTTYPREVFENTGALVQPTTVYPFSAQGRYGGYYRPGEMWINANQGSNVETITHHEITHSLDKIFPSNTTWGKTVYGDEWGRAYAAENGFKAQFTNDWPVGFAREYGYKGGAGEDKATVVQGMFTNYKAMQKTAETDLTLATKMQMIQNGFVRASNGVMNQAWWDRLTPVNPTYTVPQGNLVTKLIQGLQTRASQLRTR